MWVPTLRAAGANAWRLGELRTNRAGDLDRAPSILDEGGPSRLTAVVPAHKTADVDHADVRPAHAIVADLGQHVVGVGYQHTLEPWVAAQLAADYYQPWTQNVDFLGTSGKANTGGDLRGLIARGRLFFFPLGGAPAGLWVSPFAQVGVGWGLRGGERRAGPVWAFGQSVGYSIVVAERVLLGLGVGVQYHAARIPGGDGPPSFGRLYPQLDIQAGYAF